MSGKQRGKVGGGRDLVGLVEDAASLAQRALHQKLGKKDGHEVHQQGRDHLADAHPGLHRCRDGRPQRPRDGGGGQGDGEDEQGAVRG